MERIGILERLSIFAALCLFARGARGEDAWFDVPPECGSESQFRAELVRLVGADAERARPTRLVITREAPGGTFILNLEVAGRARELSHADCRVLFRSALVVAAASVRPEQPTPPATTLPPPPPREEPRPSPQRQEPSTSAPMNASLAFGAGLALGVLPGAAGAFELRGGLGSGAFGGSLGVRYLPARFVAVEGRGVDVQALGFRVAGTVLPLPALGFSLGVDADWVRGTGSVGVENPVTDSAWAVSPSLEVELIPFRAKHLAVEFAAEGRLTLARPSFDVRGFRTVWQMPEWGLLALARGVWRFP